MEVFWDLAQVPSDLGPTAVTIGNFDGVHRGHQAVLGQLADAARERGLTSVAVTFDPHPARIHNPEAGKILITGLPERLARMSLTGLDAVLVQNYTLEFAHQSPEEFVRNQFVAGLDAKLVLVGHDVRFGWRNSGDIDTLRSLGAEYGFEVAVIDDVTGGGSDERFSSTAIRGLLVDGDVAGAAMLLGTAHVVAGTVVHGDARGRDLGFPTANVGGDIMGIIPSDGVYAGWVTFDNDTTRQPAAISVGSNPTFAAVDRRVEAHIIDRNDEEVMDFDVYGKGIRVEFVEHLRPMVAYTGLEELIAQMKTDVDQTREILRRERGWTDPAAR